MLQQEMDEILARRPCENCCGLFSPAELKTCSGCRSVRYCSVACSKAAWKAHKPICKATKDNHDLLEEIATTQPYELVFKEQFKHYCEAIAPLVSAAAAQAYAIRARGYPAPKTPGPQISPATHVLAFFWEFDLTQRELLKQFNFLGAQSVPIPEMQKRNRGAVDQKLPQLEPGIFTRQWLDNVVGMKGLPVDNPRIPVALEAHFARNCWGATGGPSWSAQHTGISMTLELPPGMSFPVPDPARWIFDFGDRLSRRQEVGWKEKQEIRTQRAKDEFKKELLKASPEFPDEQFEAVWQYRQNSQQFYGLDD